MTLIIILSVVWFLIVIAASVMVGLATEEASMGVLTLICLVALTIISALIYALIYAGVSGELTA